MESFIKLIFFYLVERKPRMEKINMKVVRCQAKVIGTIVTVSGAMLMTLYKGPIMEMVWSKHIHPRSSFVTDTTGAADKDWVKGSIFLIIATFAWASFFILQVTVLFCSEKYCVRPSNWVRKRTFGQIS